jgi:ELWxxDGT repeat protein
LPVVVEALEERMLMHANGIGGTGLIVPPPTLQLSAAEIKEIDLGGQGWQMQGEPVDVNTNIFGHTLFFVAETPGGSAIELWKSDGTAAGTVPVRNPGGANFGSLLPGELTAVGHTLFFEARAQELWKSDGTAAGTVLVKNINPAGLSQPQDLISVNNKLIFDADDGQHGRQLWISDGTAKGTKMLTDIGAPGGNPFAQPLISVNNVLYFTAFVGTNAPELWEHTLLVGNIDLHYTNPSHLTAVGTSLYFTADDPNGGGPALFVINGKGKRVELGLFHSAPDHLTNVNGTLFFSADDGLGSGTELWMSNGTQAGTVMVADINQQPTGQLGVDGDSNPDSLVSFNGLLYFSADDGINGRQLWVSNGTKQGTFLLQDINPAGDPGVADLTVVGSGKFARLFFIADDGSHGSELWSTDGTALGAALVRDITPGSAGSSLSDFTVKNGLGGGGTLFFALPGQGGHGDQLWATGYFAQPWVTCPGQVNNEGDKVNVQVYAGGGTLTYSATNLPPGLKIDSNTGVISGTVSLQAGAHPLYVVTVTVANPGLSAAVKFAWTVIDTTTPVVQNPGPQTNNEGDTIQLGVVATDADNDPLTYLATNLPPGLSIDSSTGLISGTLGAVGTYVVTVFASDGQNTGSAGFTWKVIPNAPPVVFSPGMQFNHEGANIDLAITAQDPNGLPLVFSATNLPSGLTIDPKTGLISGTLGNQAAGTYQVTRLRQRRHLERQHDIHVGSRGHHKPGCHQSR